MPTFLYRGYQEERFESGCRHFATKTQLEEYLIKNSFTKYEVLETETKFSNTLFRNVSAKETSIFCRQMSVLFFSDISLMEGLALVTEQTENAQIKIALNEILKHMDEGLTFAESIAMYTNLFSSYMLNMVKVGEVSGTLDVVFVELSNYYEKENKVRKRLKSAVTYPLVLSIMMAVIIGVLIIKILPMFNDVLKSMGGQMPALTRWMLSLSAFLAQYGLIILGILLIAVLIISQIRKTENSSLWFDKLKVQLPLARYIYSRAIVSRISRSLSLLLKSGIQIIVALKEMTAIIDNKHLENEFKKSIKEVEDGKELSEALKKMNIFPPLFLKMIVIGEKTGNLDEMLERSSSIFDEELEDAVEKVTALIEPILILILSVVIGIILISVMLPMISIMTSIG